VTIVYLAAAVATTLESAGRRTEVATGAFGVLAVFGALVAGPTAFCGNCAAFAACVVSLVLAAVVAVVVVVAPFAATLAAVVSTRGAERFDGKIIGVSTMTRAISTSARRVRLSMQRECAQGTGS
jgi:hypothetical protein